jgi:predicted amidohydrolase YtcJ
MTTTLLRGGSVYSPADPFATALVVDDTAVTWVGRDDAADSAHRDRADEVVELDGALVTPAFVDAHVHATSTGLTLGGLDFAGSRSLGEALGRLERYAAGHPGAVVLGHGWDETRWPERRPPTAAELDRAAGGARVYLSRVDVHSAVVSPALLDAVPEARAAPGFAADGRLTRQAHHLVRAAALALVTPGQRRAAQRLTRARAAAAGIGCLHELGGPDISSEDDFTGLLALARAEPGPDVLGYWGELLAVDKAGELGALGAAGDLFADGALGSRTAALRDGYADQPESHGQLYLQTEQLAEHIEAATRAGQQAGFHCIGDAAVEAVVTAFGQAAGRVGPDRLRAARHRIEHVEMISPALVGELASLGVVASVQPAFDAAWGGETGMYAERLGPDRAAGMNPFAAMAAAGVTLAFGSDSPVTPLDPWGTVRAAVHHTNPAQRITARAAFAAHTRGGWRAARRDDARDLVPGAPATYAVWRTGAAPDESGLPDLSPGAEPPACLRTVVRGRTVYTREGALP